MERTHNTIYKRKAVWDSLFEGKSIQDMVFMINNYFIDPKYLIEAKEKDTVYPKKPNSSQLKLKL